MISRNYDIEGLTAPVVQGLLDVGITQAGIARMFGVSRQAIHNICKRQNLKRHTRQELLEDVWPFHIPVYVGVQYPYQLLRDHLEFQFTGGKDMTEDRLKRLRGFYRRLRDENLVVEYDPNIPPQPGVAPRGGFAYRKRRKSDRGLLLRVNGHADLDIIEESRDLWHFPDRDP